MIQVTATGEGLRCVLAALVHQRARTVGGAGVAGAGQDPARLRKLTAPPVSATRYRTPAKAVRSFP